jgi:signal recognition particle GTPase
VGVCYFFFEKVRMLKLEYQHERKNKTRRSITEGVVVYDDDIDYPYFCRKRNVEKKPGYQEYCELWRDYVDLSTEVRWHNKPNQNNQIPRILDLIAEIKRNRNKEIATLMEKYNAEPDITKKQEELKDKADELTNEDEKTPEKKKSEYQKQIDKALQYQLYHSIVWKRMEELIKKLRENAYVKERNNGDVNKLENYERALYDKILK